MLGISPTATECTTMSEDLKRFVYKKDSQSPLVKIRVPFPADRSRNLLFEHKNGIPSFHHVKEFSSRALPDGPRLVSGQRKYPHVLPHFCDTSPNPNPLDTDSDVKLSSIYPAGTGSTDRIDGQRHRLATSPICMVAFVA